MCCEAVISQPGSLAPKAQTLPSTRFPITDSLVWYHALVDTECGITASWVQLSFSVAHNVRSWAVGSIVIRIQVVEFCTRARMRAPCWNTGSTRIVFMLRSTLTCSFWYWYPIQVSRSVWLEVCASTHACPFVMPACALGYRAKSLDQMLPSVETPKPLD